MLSQSADTIVVLGSQNSSNSQRLRELAAENGRRAFLVDGPHDLADRDFADAETVLITAGASAPESVVQKTIDWLVQRFSATVEVQQVREESVKFPLPKPLRKVAAKLGP